MEKLNGMSKKIQYLVIHCTATQEGNEVSKKDIEDWHLKGRGWDRLGYTDMIHLNGELENLTLFDSDSIISNHEKTWGATGINEVSRHIVYVGGVDKSLKPKDTRTKDQKETLEIYVKYMVKRYPWIQISGHNQFSAKACPSFIVKDWCRSIGITSKNIKS